MLFQTMSCYIKYSRDRRKGSLSVDDEDAVTGVSTDGATQLDTDGRIWIGNVYYKFYKTTLLLSVMDVH